MTIVKQDWSTRDIDSLRTTYPDYEEYFQLKQEIKQKYPSHLFEHYGRKKIYSKEERELHKKYLKEIAELIFQPNGPYQRFSWEILSQSEKLLQRRKATGRQRN